MDQPGGKTVPRFAGKTMFFYLMSPGTCRLIFVSGSSVRGRGQIEREMSLSWINCSGERRRTRRGPIALPLSGAIFLDDAKRISYGSVFLLYRRYICTDGCVTRRRVSRLSRGIITVKSRSLASRIAILRSI